MYNAPHRAKRLYFDVIPRAVDEYLANAARERAQPDDERLDQPGLAHRTAAARRTRLRPVSFAMLLNLASVVNAETPDILWGFIRRYSPGASPAADAVPRPAGAPRDRLLPGLRAARPSTTASRPIAERAALADLAETLRGIDPGSDGEAIQNVVYEVGKRHGFPELRAWFGCLYQVLLGQQEGPRFGGFVALYGIGETIALIEAALTPSPPTQPDATVDRRVRETAIKYLRHLPALLGVALLCGAIYVVQREFRHLKLDDIADALNAIPVRALVIVVRLDVLSYFVLTFYDRLGTIYAGHKVSYARVSFASFCAYALSHNLGFAAVSGAAVRYRLYAALGPHAGADRQDGRVLQPDLRPRRHGAGRHHPVRRADLDPVLRRSSAALGDVRDRRRAVGDRRRLRHAVARVRHGADVRPQGRAAGLAHGDRAGACSRRWMSR